MDYQHSGVWILWAPQSNMEPQKYQVWGKEGLGTRQQKWNMYWKSAWNVKAGSSTVLSLKTSQICPFQTLLLPLWILNDPYVVVFFSLLGLKGIKWLPIVSWIISNYLTVTNQHPSWSGLSFSLKPQFLSIFPRHKQNPFTNRDIRQPPLPAPVGHFMNLYPWRMTADCLLSLIPCQLH